MSLTVSVITPTFNRGHMIEAAVESVMQQDLAAFEHIVVDGASTDGTVERLRRFPHLHVISEPDRGLYDAINKGILVARGDVICLLNSDDFLMAGALSAAVQSLAQHPDAASACGRVRVVSLNGEGEAIEIGTPAMQRMRAQDIISGLPLTNGRFIRRSVFEKIGLFDEDFPILADRDLLGRFYLAGFTTASIDRAVYSYGTHEGSLTFGAQRMAQTHLREAIRLSARRLAGAVTPAERGFYRRWLSWAKGYAAMRAISGGDMTGFREALGGSGGAAGFSPALFLTEAVRHLIGRGERRGRHIGKHRSGAEPQND